MPIRLQTPAIDSVWGGKKKSIAAKIAPWQFMRAVYENSRVHGVLTVTTLRPSGRDTVSREGVFESFLAAFSVSLGD